MSADDNHSLIEACVSGSLGAAMNALAAGADPKSARDVGGATPLMLAAHSRNLRLVALLAPLSDPLAVDEEGWTAFVAALHGDSAKCAQFLAPMSDLRARDIHGRSALDLFPDACGDAGLLALMRSAMEADDLARLCSEPVASSVKAARL